MDLSISIKDKKKLQSILEEKEGKKNEKFYKNSLEKIKLLLLQIVINGLSNSDIEECCHLLRPKIIIHLTSVDLLTLFDHIENDEIFVLLALATGVNKKFFSKPFNKRKMNDNNDNNNNNKNNNNNNNNNNNDNTK